MLWESAYRINLKGIKPTLSWTLVTHKVDKKVCITIKSKGIGIKKQLVKTGRDSINPSIGCKAKPE